ncbi:MAG: M13 family peptidase [Chitinophagaceae bacterium]|nr:MAG: M13 family peptidase [Chitinophagaceae bacterium]
MRKLLPIGAAALALLATGCQEKVASVQQTVFFDRTAMDSSVAAGDNFFDFANGRWLDSAKIPGEYSSWGSFTTLYDENLTKLRTMLDELSKGNHAAGSLEQKAGDYFAAGMDTATIDKRGIEPLRPWLARIDSVKTQDELLALWTEGFKTASGSMLGFFVGADEKNSSRYIPVFYQGGTSLPEKGYYTRPDSATKAIRAKLVETATRYFELAGIDKAKAAADAALVLELETKIASGQRTPVELRDPVANYNKHSVADFDKLAPALKWPQFFAAVGMTADSVNVGQPAYFRNLNALLTSVPLETWKAKIRFDALHGRANLLSKPFRETSFAFGRALSGQEKEPERWKQVVEMCDGGLQDVVGQLYVARYFPPEAKLRMDTLVNNLQVAFEARILKLDWMSDSTKQKAVAKLHTFLKKIGYPTKWKDFSDVTVDRTKFYESTLSMAKHSLREQLGKIGKAVDRTEWGMTPSTVNAYYNPTFNEIVFPAGILQFPFFHLGADDAINYGGIGMVIGHEMTHGFDDQGAQYDAEGNMKNWWLPADAAQFKARGTAMVDQYNAYTVFDSLHVNGALTLGENLADLGGMTIAWDAFKMTKQGKDTVKIDGLTPDQRFFLGFAQIWRLKSRDEIMKTRLNIDPHSPEMYRVNGPLSNFDPFYATFGVKEGAKMYRKPEERVRVW